MSPNRPKNTKHIEKDKGADLVREGSDDEAGAHDAPGTMALVLIFLVTFAVYYFANWKALADVWHVR